MIRRVAGPRPRATLGALALALVATGPVLTAAPAGAVAQAGPRLEAQLEPSGDPDGSGEAQIRLRPAKRRVCATVEWQNIATPLAAHIHRRSTGAVVVDLSGSVTGGKNCATAVRRKLIRRIAAHPGRFYFNVHNEPYPAGAIQGRLHR